MNSSTKTKQKQLDKVISLYQNKQLLQAKKSAEKLFLSDKQNLTLLMLLGAISQGLGEKEKEKEYLLTLVELNVQASAVYNDLGNIYSDESEYVLAKKMFKHSLELDKNYYFAYNGLGLVYFRENDAISAIKMYEKSLEIRNDFDKTYNNLGNAYKVINNFQKAKEMYLTCLELKPNNISAYSNLAKLYKDEEMFDMARDTYEKAISIDKDNPEVAFDYGLLCLSSYDYLKGFNL